MTPAEEQIRAALAAGPTPGPWRFSSHPHDGNYMRITCSNDPAEGDNLRGYCGEANARFIAACNPTNVAELLAELDGERARSQMYADLVRGVAVVLHGEGWSDTSKLPQEVAALKAERKPLTEAQAVACLVEAGCVGTVKMSYDSGPYEITRTSINADRLIRAVERAHGITGD